MFRSGKKRRQEVDAKSLWRPTVQVFSGHRAGPLCARDVCGAAPVALADAAGDCQADFDYPRSLYLAGHFSGSIRLRSFAIERSGV